MSSWKKRNRSRRCPQGVISIPFKITIFVDTPIHLPPIRTGVPEKELEIAVARANDGQDPSTFTSLDDWLADEGILEECTSEAKKRLGLT